jgi:hypothetical protein
MTKIYGFISAVATHPDKGLVFVGTAVTDSGRWIAGSMSRTMAGVEKYLQNMGSKYNERLSGEWEFIWCPLDWDDPRVKEATDKAFAKMP